MAQRDLKRLNSNQQARTGPRTKEVPTKGTTMPQAIPWTAKRPRIMMLMVPGGRPGKASSVISRFTRSTFSNVGSWIILTTPTRDRMSNNFSASRRDSAGNRLATGFRTLVVVPGRLPMRVKTRLGQRPRPRPRVRQRPRRSNPWTRNLPFPPHSHPSPSFRRYRFSPSNQNRLSSSNSNCRINYRPSYQLSYLPSFQLHSFRARCHGYRSSFKASSRSNCRRRYLHLCLPSCQRRSLLRYPPRLPPSSQRISRRSYPCNRTKSRPLSCSKIQCSPRFIPSCITTL
mmetsp:Transcript_6437/g.9891  ORF Transcript_6437/g.9891 Transcript_6437/m.9891 type:complete len:286 (+) Transcript_6437:381-1238(+)